MAALESFYAGRNPKNRLADIMQQMALENQREQGATARQERAIAAQEASQRRAVEQQIALEKMREEATKERMLALLEERDLNERVSAIEKSNAEMDVLQAQAEEVSNLTGKKFKINPDWTPIQARAHLELFLKQADADRYKSLMKEHDDLKKDLDRKREEFALGPQPDEKIVGTMALSNPYMPQSVRSSKRIADLLRLGKISDATALVPEDSLEGFNNAIDSAEAKAFERAETQWKYKGVLLADQIKQADNRFSTLNRQIDSIAKGVPAWMLSESKGEPEPDIFGKIASTGPAKPRVDKFGNALTGARVMPGRSSRPMAFQADESPVIDIMQPERDMAIQPEEYQGEPAADAPDVLSAMAPEGPYSNMRYGDPRVADQSADYARLAELTNRGVLPVFRNEALGGYSLGRFGRERGFGPENLKKLIGTVENLHLRGGQIQRPDDPSMNIPGEKISPAQLLEARDIARRLLGIVDRPERPANLALDFTDPNLIFQPATIPDSMALLPVR